MLRQLEVRIQAKAKYPTAPVPLMRIAVQMSSAELSAGQKRVQVVPLALELGGNFVNHVANVSKVDVR